MSNYHEKTFGKMSGVAYLQSARFISLSWASWLKSGRVKFHALVGIRGRMGLRTKLWSIFAISGREAMTETKGANLSLLQRFVPAVHCFFIL